MHIGVEPRRVCARKFLQERLLIPAMPDIIANVIRVGQGQNHEVVAFAVAERAGTGGFGFLMFRLAVNDRGGGFTGIFAHAFPDTHDVAAGGVHDLAAAFFNLLLDRQFRSKSRHNHDVFGTKIGDVRLLIFPHQVLDAQR